MFKFLSGFSCHVVKRLDKKDKINFKFCDTTAWLKNCRDKHIAQYFEKKDNQTIKFGQLIECSMRNIFLEKSYTKWDRETSPRIFSEKLKLNQPLDE